MTPNEQAQFQVACELNDDAGRAILENDYGLAAALLKQAATWSPSAEGKKALLAKASEAAAMVVDSARHQGPADVA